MGCNRPGGCACRTGEDGAGCDWNTSAKSAMAKVLCANCGTLYTAAILAERKTTHGNYDDDARCSMRLIDVIGTEEDRRDGSLTAMQRHALHMICHKIARIVTGKADFKDHWDDIAGYATLVANRCEVPGSRAYNEAVADCQDESPYKVERLTQTDVRTPAQKPPCACQEGCVIDRGQEPPKYVYCCKAEAQAGRSIPRRGGFDPFKDD